MYDEDSSYYDSENGSSNDSADSGVSGLPWYLVDGEKEAQTGIKIDKSNLAEMKKLKHSTPGPLTDEYVCLQVRYATIDKKLRKKRITTDMLCG